MKRRRPPLISLITDRRRYGPERLLPAIAAAARAGVDIIQIRERDLDDRALVALAAAAVGVAGSSAVVVNDRVDIALAAGARGVHLRADSVSAVDARQLVPAGFVIGRSVHSLADAMHIAAEGGVDYLTFGTVFPSASKPLGHRATGTDELSRVCASVPIPVLAIGGIGEGEASRVARAGAAGVAGIGLFADCTDLQGLIARVRLLFDTSSGVV